VIVFVALIIKGKRKTKKILRCGNNSKIPRCGNNSKIPRCGNNSKIKYQNRRKGHSLLWLITGTSIKSGGAKLVLWVHDVVLVMQVLSKCE